jgi:very-short-patch-repair endonuclease
MCSSNRLCDDEECQACFEKSFASHEKSKYWSEKNSDVKPRQVFKKTQIKYWFHCECGHQFEAALSNITALNRWCPYCSNKKLCENEDCKSCYEKSFASHDKSKCWSEKNGHINPREVFKSSGHKYWFYCNMCCHQFEIPLYSVIGNSWCPYCCRGNKQLCEKQDCQPCFENSFASHGKSKYWSEKNGDVNPRHLCKMSGNKYWFKCECGHDFKSTLSQINGQNTWCPYCSNPPKQLCEKENCKSCFEKSFASHDKSKYWSDKNGHVKPRQIFKSSHTKYLFDCVCGHQFEAALANITALNRWCPYCGNKNLCEKEDCKTCFEKSFASQEWSHQWSEKNGDVSPRQVFKYSNIKYWFNCLICSHDFESGLNNVTGTQSSLCPYCSNPPKQLCENEDCKTCFEKSFESHKRSQYWSKKNGDVKPRQVFKSSSTKYWFDCDCGHQFNSNLNNITGLNSWCPICVNKTEKKLYEQLLQSYPNIISQFRADWCKSQITSRILPFDFVLEEQKVIIELDGRQHFVQVRNWKTPEEQFENDQYKEKCANENGYSIIRIIQEDVWNDTYDWFNDLTQNIIKITSENTIQNIYMGKKNEYNNFN